MASDQKQRGIRKVSGIVTVAAAATPENQYLQSVGGQNNRTFIVRKIMAYNAVGAATLQLGTGLGAGWAAGFPIFRLVNNQDNEWGEGQIPAVEFNANLTVQTDVLGVVVQVEVEEIGS